MKAPVPNMPEGKLTKQQLEQISKLTLAQSQDPNHKGGRKFDGGKPEFGLVPPYALEEIAKVLTVGAQKYERNNWKRVPDGPRRYFDAAQRHLWAYQKGEELDPETGLSHIAHALCCLMFIEDLRQDPSDDVRQTT